MRISSNGALRVLAVSVGVLVALAILAGLYEFAAGKPDDATVSGLVLGLLDLDSETSIATWFSIILLASAAVLAAIAGRCDAQRSRLGWWGLAIVFAFLSIDEASLIHESTTPLVQTGLNLDPDGVLRFAWVVPYAAATLIFVALFARFVWSLPRGTKGRLIGGFGLYVLGALGVETLSAWALSVMDPGVLTGLLIVAEETLEMTGASLLVLGMLWHLEQVGGTLVWGDPAQR